MCTEIFRCEPLLANQTGITDPCSHAITLNYRTSKQSEMTQVAYCATKYVYDIDVGGCTGDPETYSKQQTETRNDVDGQQVKGNNTTSALHE